MDDTISRQVAIDTLLKWMRPICINNTGEVVESDVMVAVRNILKTVPSVQPRKGKWIITSEFKDCYYAKCNQCKATQVFYYNKPLTNFCPNCGAKMKEGDQK